MKRRFIRMLNGNKRKHGIAVMAVVFCITVLASVCVACTAKPISEPVSSSSQPVSSELKNTSSNSDSTSSAQTNQTATGNTLKSEANTLDTPEDKTIVSKTKEYIINGQSDKPEADKLNWSESFLNQVNIEDVYQQYISADGKADDIESFAQYLTENAPVSEDWKKLFEADLLKAYDEKVSKYVLLEDDLFQVYVKKDGSDVPYVVVNARTGYFHG